MQDSVKNVVVISLVIGLFVLSFLFNTEQSTPEAGFLLSQPPIVVDQQPAQFKEMIQKINSKNAALHSFACDDIRIAIDDKLFLRLTGKFIYEKDRRLQLVIKSILGKEIEIGSNEHEFWFWSKRLKPEALYYADHKDLNKTRLKTPFHPMWIKGILGFDEISFKDFIVAQRGSNWEFVERTVNSQGKPVLRSIIVDPASLSIIGHYIYEDGWMICSSEVFASKNIQGLQVPTKIITRWYEENITLIWEFNSPQINPLLNNDWSRPNIQPQVNMAIN